MNYFYKIFVKKIASIVRFLMKKIIVFTFFCIFFNLDVTAEAHHCHSHYYVTYKDYFKEEQVFNNCDKHFVLKETSVYYYSNGTRRSYTYSTIINNDGSVLESGCSDVKHIIYKNKHYFTFYKNKKYQILDENGNYISIKKYKKMQEISPNRLLVKLDKKFGIIDLNASVITPIKYEKFEQISENVFLTKLNGYWGVIDSNNNILLKNENDKVTSLHDVFLLKKQDKYGIVNKNGEIILQTDFDEIKKLKEYILVKKCGKDGVLDSSGKILAEPIYKKIRVHINNLEGIVTKKYWEAL